MIEFVFVEYYCIKSRREMATNIEAAVNEFAQFDRVATQIMNTFEPLIRQLIARRDALLRELEAMKKNYFARLLIIFNVVGSMCLSQDYNI